MNKFLLILGAALAALLISGCATNETRQAEANAHAAIANVQVAQAQAAAEEAKAVQALASKIDAGGASAYLIAKAMKGLGAPQAVQVAQGPTSIWGVLWQGALQVADIAMRGYGIKAGRDVAVIQSNNQAATTIASYGAFSTMGGQIRDAGVAGYPYIQAPGAVTTTTTTNTTNNTLTGTGVIGNGTYTGPVTRNCQGGTAGAGAPGSTPTQPGGTGGSAPGGNC